MMLTRRAAVCLLALLVPWLAGVPAVVAQTAQPGPPAGMRPWADNVLLPHCRQMTSASPAAIQVTRVDAGVVIRQQVAVTTLDVHLQNNTQSRQVAEVLIPIPDGAVIRGFTFQGAADEPTAELLTRDEARATFNAIVARLRDPAIMEFASFNLLRSSVFPVDAGGTQAVRIVYEHLLQAEGDRVDYVLPRTDSVVYMTPWNIEVTVHGVRPITAVYSPSHRLESSPVGNTTVNVKLAAGAEMEPGAFRLSYLLQQGAATASLFTYRTPGEESGYFLLLAGMQAAVADSRSTPVRRELTLVLDRSGSMQGEKIIQAREAALQVIAGLEPGERFNIIAYNDTIDTFAPAAVEKNAETVAAARAYVASFTARGGTNLHDALAESLRPEPADGVLPIVLFFTDGLPTVGETSEDAIVKLSAEHNAHERRVFTFGVGVDVNTPLLNRVAIDSRAFATFVLPEEDVEAKVGRVFRGLDGPVLTDPVLSALSQDGEPHDRVHEVLPGRLPDLFQGDQLVVLGRYEGDAPLQFELSGEQGDRTRRFSFEFPVDGAGTRNAFVARLWAARKIGYLTDQIRNLGAAPTPAVNDEPDPRLQELTQEIVRLSTEFGILTEYTAFLAQEGTDLTSEGEVLSQAAENFQLRAVECRSGWASVNQEFNNVVLRSFACANARNSYWNRDMERVAITTVQQLNEGAFYRRHGRWVEGALVDEEEREPDVVLEFGTEAFQDLLWRLVGEGRENLMVLDGDILVVVDGRRVLLKGPPQETEPQDETGTLDETEEPEAADEADESD